MAACLPLKHEPFAEHFDLEHHSDLPFLGRVERELVRFVDVLDRGFGAEQERNDRGEDEKRRNEDGGEVEEEKVQHDGRVGGVCDSPKRMVHVISRSMSVLHPVVAPIRVADRFVVSVLPRP